MSFFTDEQLIAFQKGTILLDFLVEMNFLSETVYLWNGDYVLTTGGHEWQPMHGYGIIDGLGNNGSIQSESITLRISGIPDQIPDLLGLALEETPEANQQFCKVYIQFFDTEWQPIGSPALIWIGFMQPPKVSRSAASEDEGSTQELSVTAENAFFNRSRPAYGKCTDRDQQKRHPGDKFFQFVPSLFQKTFKYPDY